MITRWYISVVCKWWIIYHIACQVKLPIPKASEIWRGQIRWLRPQIHIAIFVNVIELRCKTIPKYSHSLMLLHSQGQNKHHQSNQYIYILAQWYMHYPLQNVWQKWLTVEHEYINQWQRKTAEIDHVFSPLPPSIVQVVATMRLSKHLVSFTFNSPWHFRGKTTNYRLPWFGLSKKTEPFCTNHGGNEFLQSVDCCRCML